MIRIILLFFAASLSMHCMPLEINRDNSTVNLRGSFESGDYEKFLLEYTSEEEPVYRVVLNSHGGNLEEAMTIGAVIREARVSTFVSDKCYSACVFVFVAGVQRSVGNKGILGLHRPYYEKKYFSSLTEIEAKRQYKNLIKESNLYLQKMGASQKAIDRINATSSGNIYMLDATEALEYFGDSEPFFDEWLSAKCGKLPQEIYEKTFCFLKFRVLKIRRLRGDITERDYISKITPKMLEMAKKEAKGEHVPILKKYYEVTKCRANAAKPLIESIYSFMYSARKLSEFFIESDRRITLAFILIFRWVDITESDLYKESNSRKKSVIFENFYKENVVKYLKKGVFEQSKTFFENAVSPYKER